MPLRESKTYAGVRRKTVNTSCRSRRGSRRWSGGHRRAHRGFTAAAHSKLPRPGPRNNQFATRIHLSLGNPLRSISPSFGRTGSVVVERKGKPNARGGIIGEAGALGSRQHAPENYYAEEERFWQERCPREANNAVVVQRTAPTTSPRVTKANGRAANYDYFAAEAAYRAGGPAGKSVPPDGNGPLRGTGPGRPTGGRNTTRFEEEVDDCVQEKCATQGTHVPPPSPRRTARIGCSARAKAITERKRDKVQRRKFPSLRDAESVLRGVLESVEDAPSTEEVCRKTAAEEVVIGAVVSYCSQQC